MAVLWLKLDGLMEDSEFQKIKEARQLAFKQSVEMTVNSLKIRAADKNKDWVEKEFEIINRFLKEHPEIEQKYIEGTTSSALITGKKFLQIQQTYERYKQGGIFQVWLYDTNGKTDKLHQMYVMKEYINWLPNRNKNRTRLDKQKLCGYKDKASRDRAIKNRVNAFLSKGEQKCNAYYEVAEEFGISHQQIGKIYNS